jgi:hypothetical protein
MSDAARDAEGSIRALDVHVQALRTFLELARAPGSHVSVEGVPGAQLRHVARTADALALGIERVLERIDPGLGRDAHVIAGLMRAGVPAARTTADAPTADSGEGAATI